MPQYLHLNDIPIQESICSDDVSITGSQVQFDRPNQLHHLSRDTPLAVFHKDLDGLLFIFDFSQGKWWKKGMPRLHNVHYTEVLRSRSLFWRRLISHQLSNFPMGVSIQAFSMRKQDKMCSSVDYVAHVFQHVL